MTYQMQFDEHLCNISHGFNWHGVSHGPTAIAELLVFYRLTAGFCTNVFCCIVWNLATAVELVMTCFVCIHDSAHTHARTHTHTQPFNGLLSRTTRVGRYQKKHSPTRTHPDHGTSFIIFLHLQRSMASSLFILRA